MVESFEAHTEETSATSERPLGEDELIDEWSSDSRTRSYTRTPRLLLGWKQFMYKGRNWKRLSVRPAQPRSSERALH